MALVEGAHRRHEADRSPSRRAGARSSRCAALHPDHPLAAPSAPGKVDGPLREGASRGRATLVRSSRTPEVSCHRRVVAARDRSGQRRGSGSAQFAAVCRTSGASSSRALSTPARSITSAADSSSATSRFDAIAGGGVIGGALLLWHPEGAHPQRPARLRRARGPAAPDPRDRAKRPVKSASPPGMVWSGWSREDPAPAPVSGAESVEPGGAADVAHEAMRRGLAGISSARTSWTRRVGNAEQGRLGARGSARQSPPAIRRPPAPPPRGRGGDRPAGPAGTDDGERGGARVISSSVPFQFSHRRYQTELAQLFGPHRHAVPAGPRHMAPRGRSGL